MTRDTQRPPGWRHWVRPRWPPSPSFRRPAPRSFTTSTTPSALDNGIISADPPGANNAALAADDFVVPSGQTWTLDGVDVRSTDGAPLAANVFVYASAGSVPGALVASRLSVPYGGAQKDRSVALSPVCRAPARNLLDRHPGDRLLGVGRANRPDRTPGSLDDPAGRAPVRGRVQAEANCGIVGTPDQAFRINGTSTAIPAPATTAPAKKRSCKKIKNKQKRKKCKRKRKKKR